MRTFIARVIALVLLGLVAWAPGGLAARLEIPLRVPFETVREALSAQLAAASGAPGFVYREGRCRYLKLETPQLDGIDGRLRLVGPGSAALGVELLGGCQNAAAWQGSMQFILAPQLDGTGRLRLRVVDSSVTDAGGSGALGFIWELSKRQVHPRLEQFSYDFAALRSTMLALMRSVAPPEQHAALEQVLAQLQLQEPRVEATGIVLPIALEIPDSWLAAPPPAAAATAPLSEAELEALERALQPWDAFVVYSIKQVALDKDDGALRQRLFTLLLDSRYRLTEILSGEATAAGDPLRALFIEVWSELRSILAAAALPGHALFIDAGDALLELDRAAPGLGMRVSADGLRQLARTLRPAAAGDPLEYDWAVDPQLRRLFDVQEPAAPSPVRRGALGRFLRAAYAAEAGTPAAPALDRWVPKRAELEVYEARIGDLLQTTAAGELQRATLPAPFSRVYRDLVPTTALIESCWRQYAQRAGKVTYLRSAAGSVGLMQINQHVWRGFYDVQRLRWDTAYNARAGAQILMRYVKDYAIPYAARSGDPDHVPRAAYAVYNAGPRAVGRFNKPVRHPREERVDERLWNLYRGIAAGGRADLGSCGVKQLNTRG